MDAISRLRRQERRHNLRPLGVNGDQVRGFVSEVTLTGSEAMILALPFMNSTDPDDQQELQDPTTGQFFFMSGIDAAGDPAAPVHG